MENELTKTDSLNISNEESLPTKQNTTNSKPESTSETLRRLEQLDRMRAGAILKTIDVSRPDSCVKISSIRKVIRT